MSTRIDIPEGEDPFFYVMAKAGSPRLLASRNEGWDALYINDSTLTPREREVARIRSAHAIRCTVCLAARMSELPGFSDDEEIPEDVYRNIIGNADWSGYTVREKLISRFTALYFEDIETLVEDAELWATLRVEFSDVELVDLCLLNGFWFASARMWDILGDGRGTCAVTDGDPKPDVSEVWQTLSGGKTHSNDTRHR